MAEKPGTMELSLGAGISKSYASEILSGTRAPSLALAIHIFRRTGWRHPSIASFSPQTIDEIEAANPYVAAA